MKVLLNQFRVTAASQRIGSSYLNRYGRVASSISSSSTYHNKRDTRMTKERRRRMMLNSRHPSSPIMTTVVATRRKEMFGNGNRFFSTSSSSSNENKNPSLDWLYERGIITSSSEDGLIFNNTLHELQVNSAIAFQHNTLFGTYTEEGKEEGGFQWMTYGEFNEKVELCRSVLSDLGVGEFSKVGLISNNRWEWAAIAAASYSLNAAIVPMYEAQLSKDWAYIINDSGCNTLFVANQDIFDRVHKEVLPSAPSINHVLSFDAPQNEPYLLANAMDAASKRDAAPIIAPTPDDLADLIYTSGTTGKPKGVELLHSNITSNIRSIPTMVPTPRDFVDQHDRSLAFLPWAHAYGQTCELWCFMNFGASMAICRGVPHILQDLEIIKPSQLFAVPTLYKRVFDGVNNLMENASPIRKLLMKRAFDLGKKKAKADQFGGTPLSFFEQMQFNALDSLVLSKIRTRFGGNLRHGYVAGAACPPEVIQFMDAVGIRICEGYGLTETSPIITVNSPQTRTPGSVGLPITDVNVVITGEDGQPLGPGQEGEICCFGPNVMRGYHGNQEATDEVISLAPDGKSRMFHTGDLGRMDANNWVYVTGRLKEQYKLENGKYVSPTPIEEAISMSRFITQVVLCGANRPHNVALIVPDWNAISNDLNIAETIISEAELVNDERVKTLIDTEIQTKCAEASIKKFEIPLDWAIVAPFTAANNMLTPKMSIRRHMVIRTYEGVIANLYGDKEIVKTTTTEADDEADGSNNKEASATAA